MQHHIYLIGYRGSGKSTIGIPLAAALGCGFVDTDRMICNRCNMAIADLVARQGWLAFRQMEAEALRLAASQPDRQVIATGGGAVLHGQVWETIRSGGFVVWLRADIATLVGRLSCPGGSDPGRPALTRVAIEEEIAEVLAERTPLYSHLADMEVDTGRYDVAEVVQQIVMAYRKRCAEGA